MAFQRVPATADCDVASSARPGVDVDKERPPLWLVVYASPLLRLAFVMSAVDPYFSSGEVAGLVLVVIAAFMSGVAVAMVLVYLGFSIFQQTWSLSGHTHFYFLNLMVAEFVQAMGGMMTAEWVREHRVLEGMSCNAQAVFKQLGDVGVALTSMSIAIHTFLNIVLKVSLPPFVAPCVIGTTWTIAILFVAIPAGVHSGQYYGDTGYWCWIRDEFDGERIGLEYLWLYLAAFVSLICYACIAATVKGYDVRSFLGANRAPHVPSAYKPDRVNRRRINQMAMQMLFYPAIYTITVFPIAVVRWTAFAGHQVPPGATIFSSFIFSLSGFLNVLLFGFTRRGLIPYPSQAKSKTKSSFASPGMATNLLTTDSASVYSQTTYMERYSYASSYPGFKVEDAPPLPALPAQAAFNERPKSMGEFREVSLVSNPRPNVAYPGSYWI